MSGCYCDYGEYPAFFRASRPLARKEHKCTECGIKIKPGDRYEYSVGKYDGEIYTHKVCTFCLMIRDMMENRMDCFCWLYSSLAEDVDNALMEDGYKVPGLRMAVGRILIERKREKYAQNEAHHKTLVPVRS